MTVEQWLGKDNLLGIDIWMRKYRKNEESFDEWLDRVSGNNEAIKAFGLLEYANVNHETDSFMCLIDSSNGKIRQEDIKIKYL